MNYPDAPNGGIAASLEQAAGYQVEIFIAPGCEELNIYPPLEDLSASGELVRLSQCHMAQI